MLTFFLVYYAIGIIFGILSLYHEYWAWKHTRTRHKNLFRSIAAPSNIIAWVLAWPLFLRSFFRNFRRCEECKKPTDTHGRGITRR